MVYINQKTPEITGVFTLNLYLRWDHQQLKALTVILLLMPFLICPYICPLFFTYSSLHLFFGLVFEVLLLSIITALISIFKDELIKMP
jgi:hypothetical protein